MSGPAEAARRSERLVRGLQRDHRVPALTAAVARPDRPLWTAAVGEASPGTPVTADTQFRVGSITKTFTAVLVMQLRDEGLLGLDDRIDAHLDVPAHGDLSVRHMLSHLSGLQREPYGDVWDTMSWPAPEQMLADLARVERVLPAGRRWHYSNLAYAMLGELIGRLRGGTWAEVATDRLLRPLHLDRTTMRPEPPYATGYLVEAFSDHAHVEPAGEEGALSSAGQLWSTVGDLTTWASFLADPDPKILQPSTVDEMVQPTTMVHEDEWAMGWGLGLMLAYEGGRTVHVGHEGGMPGFLSGVYVDRAQKVAAAALGSSGTAGEVCGLPHPLIRTSLEHDPRDTEPWTPGTRAPKELASVLGPWWTEGSEFVFSWRDGHLEARAREAARDRPPAVFAPESEDVYRAVSGREHGEQLRLTRDDAGDVVLMHWATYRVTREQETFDRPRG